MATMLGGFQTWDVAGVATEISRPLRANWVGRLARQRAVRR
jgi:hypothetical protein